VLSIRAHNGWEKLGTAVQSATPADSEQHNILHAVDGVVNVEYFFGTGGTT
jgi:hypothetical protein